MHQLKSELAEKDGVQVGDTKCSVAERCRRRLQPQYVVYFANIDSEASTFPRYYINPASYNYVVPIERHIKMLPTSGNCFNSDETRSRSACYVRTWLYRQIVNK